MAAEHPRPAESIAAGQSTPRGEPDHPHPDFAPLGTVLRPRSKSEVPLTCGDALPLFRPTFDLRGRMVMHVP